MTTFKSGHYQFFDGQIEVKEPARFCATTGPGSGPDIKGMEKQGLPAWRKTDSALFVCAGPCAGYCHLFQRGF